MRDVAIVRQQLDHAWHCYCQTAKTQSSTKTMSKL